MNRKPFYTYDGQTRKTKRGNSLGRLRTCCPVCSLIRTRFVVSSERVTCCCLVWHRSSISLFPPLAPFAFPHHPSLNLFSTEGGDPSTCQTSTWLKSLSASVNQLHPPRRQRSVPFKTWTPEAKNPMIHPPVALPQVVPTRTSVRAAEYPPQWTLVALVVAIPYPARHPLQPRLPYSLPQSLTLSQLKLFQNPDLPHRLSRVLLIFSLHRITPKSPQDPPSLICITHLFILPYTHPHPPKQLSRNILCHLFRPTLTRLLFSELTTSNNRSLPLGRTSAILAFHQRNIFLQLKLPVIPTPPLPLVYLMIRTSHPSNNSSMTFATDPRRCPMRLCRLSPLDVSGFFLPCLSYAAKEGSAKVAKGRKPLGSDPHLYMVSTSLMFHDHHSYHNSFGYMSTSSTTA